jgi:hypothetical protein
MDEKKKAELEEQEKINKLKKIARRKCKIYLIQTLRKQSLKKRSLTLLLES